MWVFVKNEFVEVGQSIYMDTTNRVGCIGRNEEGALFTPGACATSGKHETIEKWLIIAMKKIWCFLKSNNGDINLIWKGSNKAPNRPLKYIQL